MCKLEHGEVIFEVIVVGTLQISLSYFSFPNSATTCNTLLELIESL